MNTIHAAQAGQGGPVSIACINKATVDLGVPFDKLTAALQKCYDQHFLPVWGYPVKLYNTKVAKPSDWQFVYFDDADEAGALGYHDLTKDGQPVSKIFVKTTLADHQLVSVTAATSCSRWSSTRSRTCGRRRPTAPEYAYEMCDPGRRGHLPGRRDRDVEFRASVMVRAVQASARYEVRSSRAAQETLQHDQGRLRRSSRRKERSPRSSLPRQRNGGSRARDRLGHRSEHRKPQGLVIEQRKRRPMAA